MRGSYTRRSPVYPPVVRTRARLAGALLAAFPVLGATFAQTTQPQSAYPNQYPEAIPERKGPPPPRLVLNPIAEVKLPGPIPPGPIEVQGTSVRVAVAGGVATVRPEEGAEPSVDPNGALPAGADGWVHAPDGKLRFRVDGLTILAEHPSRFARDGWRKSWRLRVGIAIPSPPVVLQDRLCFAALDDQVTCLRADNGHRLWATDLGERLSRRITPWRGNIPTWNERKERIGQEEMDVLLVVPDSGGSIVALDAYNGRILAKREVAPSEGWLVTPVAVVGEAKLVVARQGYDRSEAALAVFQLASPEARPGPDATPAVSYNLPTGR